jgi:uncharacterized protein (TIGR03083 family)
MGRGQSDQLWALAQAERVALAKDLAGLSAEQWRHDTSCGKWDVEQVVAHLTAAASLNQRQLGKHRGSTPAETLDRFRAVISSTTAPSWHTPAFLGEIVVHGQDIRQPLGLAGTPSVDALTARGRVLRPARLRRSQPHPGSRSAAAGLRSRLQAAGQNLVG